MSYSLEEAQKLLEMWMKQDSRKGYHCAPYGNNSTFLPGAEIERTSDGFTVHLFWICARCGEKLGR